MSRLRTLIVALVALLAAAAAGPATAPAAVAGAPAPAVVGGAPAPISQLPFQVALYDRTTSMDPARRSRFCGGVIRDATHVITAAHCVFLDPGRSLRNAADIGVLAGTNDLSAPDRRGAVAGTDYVEDTATQISFNPAYDPDSHAADVALLTLAQPLWSGPTPAIDGKNRIAPIAEISSAQASGLAAGTVMTVSGWGLEDPVTGLSPLLLQAAQLGFVPVAQCQADWGSALTLGAEMLCAGGGSGDSGRAPCFGDSGGPLVVIDTTNPPNAPADYALAGIVDLVYAGTCAQQGFPSVFQSVAQGTGNAAFLNSNPPPAPAEAPGSYTTILGLPPKGPLTPGTPLVCRAGTWANTDRPLEYRFIAQDGAGTPHVVGALADYTVQATDVGRLIHCEVTARGGGGWLTDADLRDATRVTDPLAPAEASSGTTMTGLPPAGQPLRPGTVLTCVPGQWSNVDPAKDLTYGFYYDNGSAYPQLLAQQPTYTVTSADVGQFIYCAVTATNSHGAVADADYVDERQVTDPPLLLTAPQIIGTAQPGSELICLPGAWAGTPAPSLTYRFDETLPGGIVLTLGGSDNPLAVPAGTTISCTVTATNAWGQVSARSSNQLVEGPGLGVLSSTVTVTRPRPSLSLESRVCSSAKCVLTLAASAGGGPPLTSLTARLTETLSVRCTRHGRPARCSRSITRGFRGVPGVAPGTFVLTLRGLGAGLHLVGVLARSADGTVSVSALVHVRVPRR